MELKSIKTKLLISLCAMAFSVTNCLASNVLSQIEISPSEENGYKISFGAQKPSEVKKIVSSDNKMIIEMKGLSVSSAYNTIYNNVVDVENVVVEAVSKNSAKVTFEGENIANSQIFFETTHGEGVVKSGSEKIGAIELSRPVSEYAPVYSEEFVQELEVEDGFADSLKSSLISLMNNKQLRRYAKAGAVKVANNATKENLAYILLGIGFLALVLKVLKPAKKQEPASIGLSQSLKNKEIERAKEMALSQQMQPRAQRIQEPTFNSNAGYAMKSYQASQKSPYTSSMHKPTPSMQQKVTYVGKRPVRPARVAQKVSQPIREKAPVVAEQKVTSPIESKKINVDSAKFLESMAKIYEKNGRLDLARGLKENMKKVDLQIQNI